MQEKNRISSRLLLTALTVVISFVLFLQVEGKEPDWNKVESEIVQLLQRLIQVDTQNPPGNELAACRVLKSFFDREGIGNEIYKVDETRANFIARLHGNGSKEAVLLAAHTDVVPFDEDEWSVPPLSGTLQDGFIYGRGALDDKGRLAVHAMTIALLKRHNVPLRRDIILLATAGEETGGSAGAGWMLERHRKELDAAFALNEGGRIISMDGKLLYVGIQTEEKAAYNVSLIVSGTTGHASVPRIDNAINSAAKAIERIARYSSPRILDPVTAAFFSVISKKDQRVRLVDGVLKTENPLYLALMTNTISPTLIQGGVKTNVHPPEVTINLNCRLLPGQDVGTFVDTLRSWVGPGPYQFKCSSRSKSHNPSSQEGIGYMLVEQVCREMFPGVSIVPYLSAGMSDATRLRAEGIPTYGLLPFPLDEDEVRRMHGKDERISVEALMTGMKLVYRIAVLAGK
ncbi:hypothetical protein CEE37_06360 [candidate division LCP-89 bacterium B3_LCP]|uniref:Peptidase M20 dimerisation domain-containing protein n=1 Tax=candidate division LCP-89 bacterium B3_LCP TaxID=2012998 RepID=A0A532V254_UNCL8|nr:MAG: hypothetical protein CEE37_06360 [candidate division LCP-89 bacterium B3_LCP]